jgi:hypothetical protein
MKTTICAVAALAVILLCGCHPTPKPLTQTPAQLTWIASNMAEVANWDIGADCLAVFRFAGKVQTSACEDYAGDGTPLHYFHYPVNASAETHFEFTLCQAKMVYTEKRNADYGEAKKYLEKLWSPDEFAPLVKTRTSTFSISDLDPLDINILAATPPVQLTIGSHKLITGEVRYANGETNQEPSSELAILFASKAEAEKHARMWQQAIGACRQLR